MSEIVATRVLRSEHDGGPPVPVEPLSGARHGSISMVGSRGMARRLTYRAIYLTNPWIYAIVNKQARDLARMPLHTQLLDADGNKARQRSDVPSMGPLGPGQRLDRILTYPANGVSAFAHLYGTVVDRLVYGNALWEILRTGGGGNPTGVQRLKWRDVVQVSEASNGAPLDYEYQPSARDWGISAVYGAQPRPRHLAPSGVVHFGAGADPESCVAVSPLEACRYTVALYEAVVRQLIGFFGNEARPSAAFTVDNLTPEKAAAIREMILDAYASPENAGKVLVTSGKYEPLTSTPDHNSVIEIIRLAREEAATVYGMPPPVIGILEDAIKSNVVELRTQYLREVIGPLAAEHEAEIMGQLVNPVPAWAYHAVEFQLAEALRPDIEARSEVYERLKFVLSIDEIRKLENLAPLGIRGVTDSPWIDSGATPLAAWKGGQPPGAQQAPAPAAEPATPGQEDPALPRAASNGHAEHVGDLVDAWEGGAS